MNKILDKIKITKDLYLLIYNYLSTPQKYILKINSKYCEKNLIKYDSKLMCYYIKKNIISNPYELIIQCAKFGKLKNMIWLLNNDYINRYNDIIEIWTFANAAEYGDLNILKWLLKNDFRHDCFTFDRAQEMGIWKI